MVKTTSRVLTILKGAANNNTPKAEKLLGVALTRYIKMKESGQQVNTTTNIHLINANACKI